MNFINSKVWNLTVVLNIVVINVIITIVWNNATPLDIYIYICINVETSQYPVSFKIATSLPGQVLLKTND